MAFEILVKVRYNQIFQPLKDLLNAWYLVNYAFYSRQNRLE